MAEIVLLIREHPEETISTRFAVEFKKVLEMQGNSVEILPIRTTKYSGFQWSPQIAANLIYRLETGKKPIEWNGKTWNNSFQVLDALVKDHSENLQSNKILHEISKMPQFAGKHVFSMHSTKSEKPKIELAKVTNKPEAVGVIEVFAPYRSYPETANKIAKKRLEVVARVFNEWNKARDLEFAGNREFLFRYLNRARHYSDTSPNSIAMVQKPQLLKEMATQVLTFVRQSEQRIMQQRKLSEERKRPLERKPNSKKLL